MRHESPTEVVFIGGRSGVGKSSVAAEASRILARAEVRHAVIEGDTLDQAYPEPWREGIDLAERNFSAIWANYRAIGYSRVIFTNTVSVLQVAALSAALGGEVRAVAVLLTSAGSRVGRSATRCGSTSSAAPPRPASWMPHRAMPSGSPPTVARWRRSRKTSSP
jgi:predicted ATPase